MTYTYAIYPDTLIVCGDFNEQGGRPSSIMGLLAERIAPPPCRFVINGGHLSDLEKIDFTKYKVILWAPNIPNETNSPPLKKQIHFTEPEVTYENTTLPLEEPVPVQKILPEIKRRNPHCVLISTKQIRGGDYNEADVVGRLLKSKSNLGIMIDISNNPYHFRLIDPLGNSFYNGGSVGGLGHKIVDRIGHLRSFTRLSSVRVGDAREAPVVDPGFIGHISDYGNAFTKFVNAVNPNRFLGNAATRCSFGFPAVKNDERIYVSRRNVDKTHFSPADFVEVERVENAIHYYGDHKPSVDAPIQVELFKAFPKVRYMIHGHVYIQDAPYVGGRTCVPCGALEEAVEIKKLFREDAENFSVNLPGHGCLILAKDLLYFDNLKLKGRPFPERND